MLYSTELLKASTKMHCGLDSTILLVFNIFWVLVIALIANFTFPREYLWVLWIFLATQFVDNLVITSRTLLIRRVTFTKESPLLMPSALVCPPFQHYCLHGKVMVSRVWFQQILLPPWSPFWGIC